MQWDRFFAVQIHALTKFTPAGISSDVRPSSGLPAIATAAVLGILLNAVFLIFKPPLAETAVLDEAVAAAD